MNKQIKRASIVNIALNTFILIIITIFGFIFSSLSMISKAIESFADILTAIVIHYSIKINNKKPDDDHQFGHTRAENIAGYTIGIVMIVLSFTIVLESILYLFSSNQLFDYSIILIYITVIGLVVKLFLYFYMSLILKKHNSPALKANKEDHLNDIYMFIGILLAFIGASYGYYFLDSLVGLVIGILIFRSGIILCKENIDFLMGKVADKKTIKLIKTTCEKIKEVKKVNKIKTQYLGTSIQVEIHIALDSNLTLKEIHNISHRVQDTIEKLKDIEHCFVHIEEEKK